MRKQQDININRVLNSVAWRKYNTCTSFYTTGVRAQRTSPRVILRYCCRSIVYFYDTWNLFLLIFVGDFWTDIVFVFLLG